MNFDTNIMRCAAAIGIALVAAILLFLALRLPRREYRNLAQPFLWRRVVRAGRALAHVVKPLAMHNPSDDVTYATLNKISIALSAWYLDYGNFLTDPVREAYTILQDAIQIVLRRAARLSAPSEGAEPWRVANPWAQTILRRRDFRTDSTQIQQLEAEQGLTARLRPRRILSILNDGQFAQAPPRTQELDLHPDYVLARYLVVRLRAALVVDTQCRSAFAAPLILCD